MTRETPHNIRPLQHSAAAADGKVIITAVVSHQKLLAEIEARNPIVASRRKSGKPNGRPGRFDHQP
jgi:hypothetical protein